MLSSNRGSHPQESEALGFWERMPGERDGVLIDGPLRERELDEDATSESEIIMLTAWNARGLLFC